MTRAATAETVLSYLESTLGLSFTGQRRERVLATIGSQWVAHGRSFEEYLAALMRPGPVLDRLVGEVTVGETYFFRDSVQCDLLSDVVLPAVADSTALGARIALWSAGCASGEEAFTLAALADASGLGSRCAVVGTDASARAIEKARRAVYGPWSMRSTDPDDRAAYFREEHGRFEVVPRLRDRTQFIQRNLFDGPPPPGRFDVVLCRNLLIYLTRDAVRRAGEVLAAALVPGGWLITAAGDPPLADAGLERVRTPYGLAYRRPGTPAAPGTPAPAAVRVAPAPPPPAREPSTAGARRTGPSPAVHARQASPASPEVHAEHVRLLADAGRLEEACAAVAQATRAHPLDVQLRYLAGVVLLEAGRLDEAAVAASGAVYLDAGLPAAHLLLGQVEHARGRTERARRSFRNASRLLAAAPDDARVALAGDVPAGHLTAVAARYLSTRDGQP